MSTPRHNGTLQKLLSQVQLARIRLARLKGQLVSDKEEARLARRRRKEAKAAARRAKKQARLAKREVADAELMLAEAEARISSARSSAARAKARKKRSVKTAAGGPSPAPKLVKRKARVQRLAKPVRRPAVAAAPSRKSDPAKKPITAPSKLDAPVPAATEIAGDAEADPGHVSVESPDSSPETPTNL